MTEAQADRRAQLREAATRETAAAQALAAALRQARGAAQRMDVDGLGAVLGEARRAADELARAGGRRTRLAGEAARLAGLGPDASLGPVLDGANVEGGTAAELREALDAVSREASALGICVRYGGVVVAHLAALTKRGPCYGPGGQLGASARLAGRTA